MLPATYLSIIVSTIIGILGSSKLHAEPLQLESSTVVWEDGRGLIRAGDSTYRSWSQYFQSNFFKDQRGRCGSLGPSTEEARSLFGNTADCSNGFTNPSAEYDPSVGSFRIPVVVHVITRNNGTGYISDEMVQSQIDVLNEDFLALPGSLGSPGTDCNIELYLATIDPDGYPTNGITRSVSNSWYNDRGNYKNALSWDTNRYLNIYTNTAGGYLGYAYIPNGGGIVGSKNDGVVINWQAFGRNSPYAPYDLGRTTTHEVGHYLGLYHTFQGGCSSTSGCYSNGDLICDTNPESGPNYSGCFRSTCSSSDPVRNYMDYSEDLCMDNFTPDQTRRMRCTIENWRTDLWSWDNGGGSDPFGACCIESSCSEGTEADCLNSGGTYQSNGSSCGNVSCDSGGGGGGDPVDAILVGALVQLGTAVGGSLVDIDDSDNSYLLIDADKSGPKYECRVDVSLISASMSATRLDVRTEVGASTSGSKTRIYIYDFNSSSWVRIIQYNQGTGDTVREANDISSPSNYIDSSTGEIIVRVYCIKRNGDYTSYIDEVNVTVTP